ncbi:hypothetical protein M409DRAFT_29237 [Zasmidium cellare ATCC 36951]|uniref:Uncharacterized protein n=1 Tax=Zasmidium cellare ATCC 36951 TaxID=1080233 RepID=A0A6A6C042_ZASCE|nr:uncharacterized protein M409DRAFT_29237 [Zasmidium cellare ATCC 36951]KAF2160391.1 hypothetical protein M409DRAFT_29237 [Zasmidium cellare ATCC 36951]
MRFSLLEFAAVAYAGSTINTDPTTTTTTTPAATPTPTGVCTKFPYDALLPLSTNTAAQSWCSKNFPVACTGRRPEKKIAERTADPEPIAEPEPTPTTLVKKAQKANPAALLSTLEALGKGFASTACACIETPAPC